MHFRRLPAAVLIGTTLFAATPCLSYEATLGRTGVLRYDPGTAFNGYTLLAPQGPGADTVYLIDNQGFVRYRWTLPGTGHTELAPNGDLLRLGQAPSCDGNFVNWGGTAGQVARYRIDGQLRWQYTDCDEDSVLHHTFAATRDGRTFVPIWERRSAGEAIAAGRIDDEYLYPLYVEGDDGVTPSRCARNSYCGGLWPDVIVELDAAGRETGWRWDAWDALTDVPADASRLDINYHIPEPLEQISNRSTADFMHVNNIDFDPVNNLLLITSRVFNEVLLLDYQTKQIVGRWGNPWATKSGAEPSWMNDGDTKLWGPHGGSFVASTSGSVNVLVFDNGWMRPEDRRSRALEIQMTRIGKRWEATGDPVWQFQTAAQQSLLTDFQRYAQRLPNGNTLMTSSGMAHLIEVTPEGAIAWEYVSPVFADGEIKCSFSAEDDRPLTMFRAYKYSPWAPGLRRLDLRARSGELMDCGK